MGPLKADVKQKVKEAFAAYDKDSSGFLEKKEATTALNTFCKTKDAPKQVCANVKKTLEKFDTNNDEKISLDELLKAVQKVIDSQDKTKSSTKPTKSGNNVGSPSKTTKLKPLKDEVKQKIKQAFAAFDKDNSGFLEKKEAITALNTVC